MSPLSVTGYRLSVIRGREETGLEVAASYATVDNDTG